MHHVLGIVELVEMICSHVAPSEELRTRKDLDDWQKKEYIRTLDALSQLARTSKAFLHPALDSLWSYQGTIANLLRVMPAAWEIKEDWGVCEQEPDLEISLLRPLTSSDCDRFLFYARRIKSFSLADEGNFRNPEIYEILRASFPEECLLPHLRRLHWSPVADELFEHVNLFLSPQITHLSVLIMESNTLFVLDTFAHKCPRVTTLAINCDWHTPGAIPPISKYLCSMHHLHSLNVSGLDAKALFHIAQLPALRSLCITNHLGPLPSFRPSTGSHNFPVLIHLEHHSNECSPALLQVMLDRPLVEFKFSSSTAATSTVVEAFISALGHHCAHASLKRLSLRMYVNSFLGSPPIPVGELHSYVVGEEILKPLYSFANLVDLYVFYPVGFAIDDAVICNMARAWPRMDSLSLPPHQPRGFPAVRVTLNGVYQLAVYCPRLKVLRLTFDATTVPKIETTSLHQENLRYLDVANSTIAAARPVATFLHALFPRLVNVQTLYDETASGRKIVEDPQVIASRRAWKEVVGILYDLRS
ncbi:hypothetical protein B0H16DRAFT_1465880 [Mycena metata]|uniref:F-box domain-containing protein n=1 Tax=Mycena metata TaxID=1033252 RepID=A0AAD7I9N4_9AGAR|nr:hypothetical protein B0H16DRAFT_1465880 [Mycena metata]